MPSYPVPDNEVQRLQAVAALAFAADTPDPALDALVRVAAQAFGVPAAVISLMQADHQVFVARVGVDVSELARHESLCNPLLMAPQTPWIIEDLSTDPRYATHPLVQGEAALRLVARLFRLMLDQGQRDQADRQQAGGTEQAQHQEDRLPARQVHQHPAQHRREDRRQAHHQHQLREHFRRAHGIAFVADDGPRQHQCHHIRWLRNAEHRKAHYRIVGPAVAVQRCQYAKRNADKEG